MIWQHSCWCSSPEFDPNGGPGAKIQPLGSVKTDPRIEHRRTSNSTSPSALASVCATCQNKLHACLQPLLLGCANMYASRSGPPFGSTMIAYTWETLNPSGMT